MQVNVYVRKDVTPTEWQREFCYKNAQELLNQRQLKETDRLLDIGCGDGFITAILAKQLSCGYVLGLDISESNISLAKQKYVKYKNLDFEIADASSLKSKQKFDWIVAFNSLHWIKEEMQLRFLEEAKKILSKNGKLLFTIGMRHEPIWTAIEKVVQNKKWEKYFHNFINPRAFYTVELYADLLKKVGFNFQSLQVKKIAYHFFSKQQFKECIISWLPHIEKVPTDNKQKFIDEICQEYLELLPAINQGGVVSITFNNLEVEASCI